MQRAPCCSRSDGSWADGRVGSQVRKGEKGSHVVFADRIFRTETNDRGEETEREIPFLKAYTVFNCEQIDGLPVQFTAPANPVLDPVKRIYIADWLLYGLQPEAFRRKPRERLSSR